MANTANYNWPLPSPSGLQLIEVAKIATSFSAIDAKIKAFETSYSNHRHKFADLDEKPTTLGGYGITDGMTAAEVAQAIKKAVDDLVNGSGAALDTLKELADALGNDPEFSATVSNALGVRVRVDAAQAFTLAEKAQGRTNIGALGTVDKGAANGVASLDSTGLVPSSQLPALTTTGTVGAAIAGANSKATPADGDFFAGVEAGGSTMFKTTWSNIKAALKSYFDGLYLRLSTGGTVAGPLSVTGTFNARLAVTFGGGTHGKVYFRNSSDVSVAEIGVGSITGYGDAVGFYNNGVGDWWFNNSLRSAGHLYAGNTVYATDGNITGSIWSNWGQPSAYQAIGQQIESRSYWRTQEFLTALSAGALGSYALLSWNGSSGSIGPGATQGGSIFTWSSAWGNTGTGSPGGTWRCMGYADANVQNARVTLQLRYA